MTYIFILYYFRGFSKKMGIDFKIIGFLAGLYSEKQYKQGFNLINQVNNTIDM